MKKIILAIDSYKGCLSSLETEHAAAEGVHTVFPSCQTLCLPVADGGEGILDILIEASQGSYHTTEAHDPLMRPRITNYGILGDNRTAVIEMARISGLPLLSLEERNPMKTNTYGTGELIQDALRKGYRNFLIGIGGSATNDAGMGMLQALGYRFYDIEGHLLDAGGAQLNRIAYIDTSEVSPLLENTRFTVACDVTNPFYGPQGAAYTFAPQKGASADEVRLLDAGLQHFSGIIRSATGMCIDNLPGAGAAGGLGGCLAAFLHATLKPGIDLILDVLQLEKQLPDTDLVITGEGHSDRQTLMGKVPMGILERAKAAGVPTLLLSGGIEDIDILNKAGFQSVFSTTPSPMPLELAMQPKIARQNIRETTAQICRVYAGRKNKKQNTSFALSSKKNKFVD